MATPEPVLDAGVAEQAAAAADDGLLVARCRQGDAGAWRLLVQRYQRLVYAVARSAGLDEHGAADVFQTTFARLVQALPTLAQPERLRAWIVTTTKREAWAQRARARRLLPLADDGAGEAAEAEDPSPSAEAELDRLQQLHLLRQALDRLDARCHGLLALLFADERVPYEAIAATMQMPPGSIGPTRARCLGKLRVLLAEEER